MRLTSLTITEYGCFERLSLELDPRPGCINLVVAPNGAGKSVLRQALHDLFFGIEVRSTMNFRHGYPNMSLQAGAVTQDGTPLIFGWTRKQKRTYAPGAGPDAYLASLLDQIPEQKARLLFTLDTAALREGGLELAAGGGTVGEALLSGSGELASIRPLRATLQGRADQIWEKGKPSRPLAAAAKALAEARSHELAAVLVPRHLQAAAAAIEEHEALLREARARHGEAQDRMRVLARVERAKPHIEALDAAHAWLAGHPDAPVLDGRLGEELASARSAVVVAAAKLADAQAVRDRLAGALEAVRIDAAALDAAGELEGLAEALGRTEKGSRDASGLRSQYQEACVEVDALLRAVGSRLPRDRAAELLPTAAAAAHARALMQQEGAVMAEHAAAVRRNARARAALELLMAEGAQAEPASSAVELEGLLRVIRADRDPLKHAADLAEASRRAAAAAAAASSRVPGGPVSRQAMEEAPIETKFINLRETAERTGVAAQALKDRLEHAAGERASWRRSLDQLRAADLPDDNALAAARSKRDKGWGLMLRRAFPEGALDTGAETAYASGEPLALVFERDLRAADAVADRRILEVGEVKEAARLSQQLSDGTAAFESLRRSADAAAEAAEAARQDWAETCGIISLTWEASLQDVRAVLSLRAKAADAVHAAAVLESEAAALAALHGGWASELAGLMGLSAAAGLPGLLARADAHVHAADRAEAAATLRTARLGSAQEESAQAEAALILTLGELDAWRLNWTSALSTLGRPKGESGAAVAAVLDRLAELDSKLAEFSSLARRIDGINQDAQEFETTVSVLSTRFGLDQPADVFAAARSLIRRAAAAREAQSARQQAAGAAAAAETALSSAQEAVRLADLRIEAAVAACGAADPDEADLRLAASRERERHEAIRHGAEAGLLAGGEGFPLSALRAEAERNPSSEADASRREAEEAQTAASAAAEAAAVTLGRLQDKMAADAAATFAAEAAQDREAVSARFSQIFDEFLLMSVAAGVLGRSIDEVGQSADASGVRRMSEAFATTSGGTHTVVGGEGPKGETMLLAVDGRRPHERIAVSQLSEGLRDQLYLALRIVAIGEHAAAAPCLPFIADDILQTFDDDRASASLAGLLAMSRHAQVVVLTHHRHIAELASRLSPGAFNLIHLPDVTAA